MKVTMKKFLGSLAQVVVASVLFGVAAEPTKPVPWNQGASVGVAADPTKPVPWKVAESDDPTKPVPWKNG